MRLLFHAGVALLLLSRVADQYLWNTFESRMRQTVKSKYIVDLAVEKSTDAQTPEPEAVRDKLKVLRDMAGFEQDEAVTTLPVFENRPFEARRNGDDDRRRATISCSDSMVPYLPSWEFSWKSSQTLVIAAWRPQQLLP